MPMGDLDLTTTRRRRDLAEQSRRAIGAIPLGRRGRLGHSTGVTSSIGSRQWRGAAGTSPSGAAYSTSWAPHTMHW